MEINLNEIVILIIVLFAMIEMISFVFWLLKLYIKHNLDKKLKEEIKDGKK